MPSQSLFSSVLDSIDWTISQIIAPDPIENPTENPLENDAPIPPSPNNSVPNTQELGQRLCDLRDRPSTPSDDQVDDYELLRRENQDLRSHIEALTQELNDVRKMLPPNSAATVRTLRHPRDRS